MDRNYPDQKSKEKISPFLLRNMTTALTSDAHSKFLYFYEDELKTIQRIKLNIFSGVAENWTTSELVTLAVGKVEGLAVDWVAGNLYWSDSRFQQIMVSREDGRYPFTLISEAVSKPRSLVVHPTKRFVFWCDVDEDMPRIERCGLDGSRRQSIVTGNKARTPRALAIDFQDDRLYWTDGIIIHYGKLNGTGQFCLHSSGRSAVRSLIIFNNYIIWSDVVGRLHTAHKEYSKGQEQMDGGIAFFVDLVYHDESCQPMTTNPCAINNGNCDHLCLPNKTGYRCVCALGYWNFNGRCISGVGEERFLIFADQRQAGIYQRPLFLDEYYSIPLQNIKQPRDVVYDGVKKLIYWSDIALSTISRSKINGSNQEIIFYHARMSK
ncbi:low-density lipoprotein receptor-related protein 6-like [Patella vulgata]|uniref:low-density lipoprotein receptor-related protein 6-like n=1 Tax=Patella vulgata TaxID=6465 RepID=UPI0024A9B2A5|nr:low-density lipoprotein receptor-related protein 6-like [Patella vulgata]